MTQELEIDSRHKENSSTASETKVVKKGVLSGRTSDCPLCGTQVDAGAVQIDGPSFAFLQKLAKERILQPFLQIARVHIYDIMKMGAPMAAGFTRAISSLQNEMRQATNEGFETLKVDLTGKFQQVLMEMGFPEPAQMQILAEFAPKIVDLLHQLIELETIPAEKGREGERTLLDSLTSYLPEDYVVPLGKSGETDIVARPSHDGESIGLEVLLESKRNGQSGGRRSYVDEVLRHMRNHSSKYAILAVDVMPKGANGYLTEYHSEGVVFVTSQATCHVAYGAIRAALITVVRLSKRSVDLSKALSDKRITNRIQAMYKFEEYHRKIRENSAAIVTKGKRIVEDTDEATDFFREALSDLEMTVQEVTTEPEGVIPPTPKSKT